MYNDCITFANDADSEACCAAVERPPTTNCRVVLFVVSFLFLQLFLDERVLAATKMTTAKSPRTRPERRTCCGVGPSHPRWWLYSTTLGEYPFVHTYTPSLPSPASPHRQALPRASTTLTSATPRIVPQASPLPRLHPTVAASVDGSLNPLLDYAMVPRCLPR